MTPERWRQIETIFHAAVELKADARAAYVADVCGDDADLRQEVESLLAGLDLPVGILDAPPPGEDELIGRVMGRYRVLARLGAGGMGAVYLAEDAALGRKVALKLLPAVFAGDAEQVRRIQSEARAASALNHPNIITIHEIAQTDSTPFIVMEFVRGETLRQRMKESNLDILDALDIAAQVAGALAAAHGAGIVHRDIKPENIMLREDGYVKVLDFGIAVADGRPTPAAAADLSAADGTGTGVVIGTISYMSPEQARGERLDARTDIFSLGVVTHEMLTGRHPFEGETRTALLHDLMNEELPPVRNFRDNVQDDLEAVVSKATRKGRAERYQSAEEMLGELRRVRGRLEGRKRRRRTLALAAAVLLSVVALAVALALSFGEEWEGARLSDGHTAAARRAVFSPDGRLLISAGEDARVIVWDFARRRRVATLAGHTAAVIALAFSPDGRWFATGDENSTVIVWDAARLERVTTLGGQLRKVGGLAFSPDGRLLASTSYDPPPGRTILWAAGSWEKLHEWPDGREYGPPLFTPDGRLILKHSTVDLETGLQTKNDFNNLEWNWAAVSPDGARLVAVDGGGGVGFSDLTRRGAMAMHRAHQDHGRVITFSPDGRLVASGAEDIVLWDAATQTILARLDYPAIVWSLDFSPDGRWLVSTHGDGAILLWDVKERRRVADFGEHASSVRAVAYSHDGKQIASASEDRSIIVWDAGRGRKEAVLLGHQTRVTAAAFSPDGTWLASCDMDGYVNVWDVARQQPRLTWRDGGSCYAVAVSPDGRRVANSHAVYDSADGRKEFGFYEPDIDPGCGGGYGLSFSPDGRRLARATDEGCLTLLEVGTWRALGRARLNGTSLISVSFSPDGRRLVTGEDQGAVRLWEAEPLREEAVIGSHAARVKSVAFSPDGRQVASAGDDKVIALWDVRRRSLVTHIGTHTSPVLSVAFSPDGRHLVAGEHDRSVRVYTRHRTLWGYRLD